MSPKFFTSEKATLGRPTIALYDENEYSSKTAAFYGAYTNINVADYVLQAQSADALDGDRVNVDAPFVIDVGANLGLYSLQAVAAGASVVAIELYPPNADRLELSLRLSGAADGFAAALHDNDNRRSPSNGASPYYYLFRNAVSDVSGQRVGLLSNFLRTESVINAGAQTILPLKETVYGDRFDANHHVVDVMTVTLDEVAERAGLFTRDPVTGLLPLLVMLKMDCEGCEPLALRGARRLFAENPPRVFLTEVFPAMLAVSGVGYRQYLHSIEQLGYAVYTADSEPVSPVLSTDHATFRKFDANPNLIRDFLCIRNDIGTARE